MPIEDERSQTFSPMVLRIIKYLCFVVASVPPMAVAADAQDTLDQFFACGQLEAPNERLACLDAILTTAGQSDDGPPPITVEPPPRQSRRSLEEPIPENDRKAERHAPRERYTATAKVVRVWETARGGVGVDLDNGQSWAQVETKTLIVRPNREVEITENIFGGYRLNLVGGNRSILVQRVR